MKKVVLTYGLILMAILSGFGQSVPWVVTPTTKSATVRLEKPDSSMWYDYNLPDVGDALGLFFDQSGTWVCGGYIQYDGVNNSFTVYGNDGGDNGFQNLEYYHFKYWRKSKNCVIDNPMGAMINAQYFTGDIDTIIVVHAKPVIVTYPSDYYCLNNTSVLPISPTIQNTTLSNINFEFNPYNPAFDVLTGQFTTYTNFDPGTYTINITTVDAKCVKTNAIDITFDNKLLNNNTITKTSITCTEKSASVVLDTSLLTNGTLPYTFVLENTSTMLQSSSANGEFTQVAPGDYRYIVKDMHGCADTSTVQVLPYTGNCNASNTDIITPNLNSSTSELLIDKAGTIKIYNSQGELIQTLQTPGTWNATDKNGNVVKTGAYYLFMDGEKYKEVTVVY